MSNCVAFHTQIASIMEVLANAAVAEICKVVDDGCAVLRLEVSQSLKENKALRRRLQTMELRVARGSAASARPHGAQGCAKARRSAAGDTYQYANTKSHFPSDVGEFGVERTDGEGPDVGRDRVSMQRIVPMDECADMEEGRTESLLIKEERLEEDSDPQGEMTIGEERAVGSRAAGGERPPVQETQNKPENHTEELTEPHRTRHGVWEVSGLETALKAEPEKESVKMLQHTGSEQSTGRLHSSCPEYLMCQKTSQLRTFFTQGDGETEAGDPSCSYAAETDSELRSVPPTGKEAGSGQSLGSLGVKPEVVTIDCVSTEDEAEMHCGWSEEPMPGHVPAQHRLCGEETDRMELIPGNDDVCPPYAQTTARDRGSAAHVFAPDISFDKNLSSPKGIGSHRVGRREKLFICTYCGKAFNRPKKVEIHQRVHTGEKPFRCALCGKWFAESGNLKKHQRVHTGEKPFSCTLCGKRFAWIRNLKTHQQRNHAAARS